MANALDASRLLRALALALTLVLPSGAWAQSPQSSDFPPGGTSVSSQIEARRETSPETKGGGGPAVDASGGPADDPTANVIALQRAATQRQDDLREASERFILAQIEAAEKLNELRASNSALLRAAESKRLDDLIALRSSLEAKIAEAEAKRIDAIRAVDVNAVQVKSEQASEQANVLAQQVAQSAETLRALVATTAATVATAQDQLGNALSGRIAALEQAQYVGQGRQALSDPAVIAITEQVAKLTAAQNSNAGQSEGSSSAVLWAIAGLGALLTLISIVGGLIAIFTRKAPPVVNGNGNGQSYYPQPAAA